MLLGMPWRAVACPGGSWAELLVMPTCVSLIMQADNAKREDRAHRSLDYDSHLGLERDPVSREILHTASHT